MTSYCSFMFWTDWIFQSNISGKIERAWMDGSHRETLFDHNLNYPYGLTIDLKSDHIYWCDVYSKQLERADLDGKNHIVRHHLRKSFF